MAQIHKITTGFVTQIFDTELGRWVSQSFTAGDCVYETPEGEHLDDDNPADDSYMPYDMVQPSTLKLAAAPVEITIEVEGGVVTDVSCKTHELVYNLVDNDNGDEWSDIGHDRIFNYYGCLLFVAKCSDDPDSGYYLFDREEYDMGADKSLILADKDGNIIDPVSGPIAVPKEILDRAFIW